MNIRSSRIITLLVPIVLSLCVASCQSDSSELATPDSVIQTYISIAQAGYSDSLTTGRDLNSAIGRFLDNPSETTQMQAKQAWIAARVPYQQTEAFRFGNAVVDDWEGRVNSWPLDEGLIDYTAPAYGSESDNNYFYTANIIANPQLSIGGITVDSSSITPALLSETLQEIDGVEANVATGYHAIEFLLWGQDLHGTEPGAGERSWTDYSLDQCTNGNCDRRRDYLNAVTELLVSDLEEMANSWQPSGEAYTDLLSKSQKGALATILTGMGGLAYGELMGERIRLGLLLHDPEEEHDCFSDNTHYSHYYDAKGIENVYRGRYVRVNGDVVQGHGLADLLATTDSSAHTKMEASLAETSAAMTVMVNEAEAGRTFDVLIANGNSDGEAVISRIVEALIAETRVIEDITLALALENISIEGLDDPSLVQ